MLTKMAKPGVWRSLLPASKCAWLDYCFPFCSGSYVNHIEDILEMIGYFLSALVYDQHSPMAYKGSKSPTICLLEAVTGTLLIFRFPNFLQRFFRVLNIVVQGLSMLPLPNLILLVCAGVSVKKQKMGCVAKNIDFG